MASGDLEELNASSRQRNRAGPGRNPRLQQMPRPRHHERSPCCTQRQPARRAKSHEYAMFDATIQAIAPPRAGRWQEPPGRTSRGAASSPLEPARSARDGCAAVVVVGIDEPPEHRVPGERHNRASLD
jgi:hypothetical protein